MNNELGRKITSLTLMTIMLAGGMTIAAPSMMPAAHAANANLFVSAENSQFDNYMSGPQVIEVVVIDSDINDTDQSKGEPDVTVNGADLRMVQGVDGNWYGYFADRNMAILADSTAIAAGAGIGLDFGQFCSSALELDGPGALPNVDFSDTDGVAIPGSAGASVNGGVATAPIDGPITAVCGAAVAAVTQAATLPLFDNNVVRESKDLSPQNSGQIDVPASAWPFIQLYELNPTGNVVVQYNKGGGVQTTTLTFDTVDQFASVELDRAAYTPGSEVHATIIDLWLNIDPTDEDSWTFATSGTGDGDASTTNYQVFDENGLQVGDVAANTDTNTLTDQLAPLMCEDNCRLITDVNLQGSSENVITLQDNGDSEIRSTLLGSDPQDAFSWNTLAGFLDDGTTGFVPITITEQGPNSGVFGTFDESDTSNIVITDDANRGTSASIDYNETAVSILVGLSFGNIDIMPVDDEWNSGEEIPVELTDFDANKNSRADEDLDLNDPNVDLIPSLRTGNPFTLAENNDDDDAPLDASYGSLGVANDYTMYTQDTAANVAVEKFSKRGIITPASTGAEVLVIDLNADGDDLQDSINDERGDFHGFNLFNMDIRSITETGTVDVFLLHASPGVDIIDDLDGVSAGGATTAIQVANNVRPQSLTLLDNSISDVLNDVPANNGIAIAFEFSSSDVTTEAIVADFFSFGFENDGLEADERIANQIIRIEMEESGDNTGIFEGSLEYTMINQLNVLDSSTYEDLSTIADDPSFIVIEDLTDEDSPRVNYLDKGTDGVDTQVSDQEEAPSHSGIVSFDLDTYKVADTVNITLDDLDLNVDSDLIDIYTTVSNAGPLRDVVGDDTNSIPLSDGDELGRLLDVTFDDELWTSANSNGCVPSGDSGLFATGFTLIETDRESGKFLGDFQIPADWCAADDTEPQSSTGLDIEVNYVDFRDASGEVIEVGDSAGVRANTGSISLDRTVYPVPFGVPDNFGTLTGETSPDNRSIFAIHASGINGDLTDNGTFLPNGDLIVHVRVNDPDFDVSASGEDSIASNRSDIPVGPVEISIIRGSDTVIIGHAGGEEVVEGNIFVGDEIPVSLAFSGDGIIADGELTVVTQGTGSGFVPGTDVDILQNGAQTATATFTETVGDSEIDATSGEITGIPTSENGFAAAETITVTQGNASTRISFVDATSDGNVDVVDLGATVGTPGIGFVTGVVNITGETSGMTATANFVDAPVLNGIIQNGELVITDGGSLFSDGTVTLTQTPAPTSDGVATFTDVLTEIDTNFVNDFGPMDEIAPDAGIFEIDITIQYTDGPADETCPTTVDYVAGESGIQSQTDRFSSASASGEDYCILQGDILQVEYTDPTDASGDVNTVTDSATFDLRNGVLQSDKSVYIIGSDMILTLIEPDLDLDNDQAETWDLDLIEWDSDAATITMGDADGEGASFDPEPLNFRETGDSTGIFQIVIEIPEVLEGDRLERGEEIILEYTDWGPSGSDFVGDEDEDVNLTLYTSNFGATVELDQKVYSWTDKVYVTVVAPDHNFDGDLIDEVGNTDLDPIKISTRGFDLDNYKLVETGTDTGIFTGEVILTGFTHDADGDGTDDTNPRTQGDGPTDGLLQTDDDDGLTVSFEFSEDETVVGSALIRWNIGEVQWLEASYPASGTGVVRVIDPDMNLDPEAVDNFDVDVWSDSDAGGIDLTVTETNEATGIFEGTVFFTVTDESSGHRLRVAEGDTVTAEYEDNTLPDPYTTADELDITATSLIGTVVPPLERAPIASCRVVDAFGNSLSTVSVDQQVQITCDLANGQDREQQFAYLIQVQDANGVTVSLAWITGSLAAGQSFSPALSWIPESAGAHDATAFVWESVDNPTALSPPVSTDITVN